MQNPSIKILGLCCGQTFASRGSKSEQESSQVSDVYSPKDVSVLQQIERWPSSIRRDTGRPRTSRTGVEGKIGKDQRRVAQNSCAVPHQSSTQGDDNCVVTPPALSMNRPSSLMTLTCVTRPAAMVTPPALSMNRPSSLNTR
jgi:hypothetical protein